MLDVKWHDTFLEMPGKKFEYKRNHFNIFIIRYTFEEEDTDVFYEIATLQNGKFIPNFDDWPEEDRQRVQQKARVLHWAYLDHPSDYD